MRRNIKYPRYRVPASPTRSVCTRNSGYQIVRYRTNPAMAASATATRTHANPREAPLFEVRMPTSSSTSRCFACCDRTALSFRADRTRSWST